MMTLEQLALNGATTLLSYLQCDGLTDEKLGAIALAGTLCELLNQLETLQPGITASYGWKQALDSHEAVANLTWNSQRIDHDRYSDFNLTSLS